MQCENETVGEHGQGTLDWSYFAMIYVQYAFRIPVVTVSKSVPDFLPFSSYLFSTTLSEETCTEIFVIIAY